MKPENLAYCQSLGAVTDEFKNQGRHIGVCNLSRKVIGHWSQRNKEHLEVVKVTLNLRAP